MVSVNVMLLILAVPWVSLQCMIVVFPDYTHFFDEVNVIFSYTY